MSGFDGVVSVVSGLVDGFSPMMEGELSFAPGPGVGLPTVGAAVGRVGLYSGDADQAFACITSVSVAADADIRMALLTVIVGYSHGLSRGSHRRIVVACRCVDTLEKLKAPVRGLGCLAVFQACG